MKPEELPPSSPQQTIAEGDDVPFLPLPGDRVLPGSGGGNAAGKTQITDAKARYHVGYRVESSAPPEKPMIADLGHDLNPSGVKFVKQGPLIGLGGIQVRDATEQEIAAKAPGVYPHLSDALADVPERVVYTSGGNSCGKSTSIQMGAGTPCPDCKRPMGRDDGECPSAFYSSTVGLSPDNATKNCLVAKCNRLVNELDDVKVTLDDARRHAAGAEAALRLAHDMSADQMTAVATIAQERDALKAELERVRAAESKTVDAQEVSRG